jgi:hypothetical protein
MATDGGVENRMNRELGEKPMAVNLQNDPNLEVKRALDTAEAERERIGLNREGVAGLFIMRGILRLAKDDNLAALELQREVLAEWIESLRPESLEIN